jgi:imidazolonepropionase-like amidohydrolase
MAMYEAEAPTLAGIDANSHPAIPCEVPHGESVHHEQELLVAAGLSNLDSIRAATCLPAKYFRLNDHVVIEPGRRANLLLTGGNQLEDIGAACLIKKVWCSGIDYKNVIS